MIPTGDFNSLANRHLDLGKKAEAVEFFVGALLEVWLRQNDYYVSDGRRGGGDRDLMAFWVRRFFSTVCSRHSTSNAVSDLRTPIN